MKGEEWIDRDPDWIPRPRRPQERVGQSAPTGDGVPIVIWIPVACPHCDSIHCPTTGTPKAVPGMRYHKCSDCGRSFKSFERRAPKPTP